MTAAAAPAALARRDAGGSLIELTIGVVVMVVGLLGIMSVATNIAQLRKVDAELDLAFAACRNNIEELRAQPISALPGLDGADFDVPGENGAPGGLRAVPGDPDGLPGEISVTIDQQTGTVTLYRVEVSVVWTGASDKQQLKLSTLMGQQP